jgi:hypothetical protein
MGYESMEWIKVAQDTDEWRSAVNKCKSESRFVSLLFLN